MRCVLIAAFVSATLALTYLTNVWPVVAIDDPNTRMAQLLTVSEGLGAIEDDWRNRSTHQLTELAPIRVHGGIGP